MGRRDGGREGGRVKYDLKGQSYPGEKVRIFTAKNITYTQYANQI